MYLTSNLVVFDEVSHFETCCIDKNMKEIRFSAANGEWRLAFAFDPDRKAILLVAGDKSGGNARRFYRVLIRKADERFDRHLARIEEQGGR